MEGQLSLRYIHDLMLTAFVGACPDGMECRHLNDISTDNRRENLCWGTRKENAQDMVRNDKARKQATDIPDETLDKIRNSPKSNIVLAREHNLKLRAVAQIKNGTWNQATISTLRKLSERYDIPLSTLQRRFTVGDRGDDLFRDFNIRSSKHSSPSGIPGIYWFKNIEKWYVRPRVNGQTHYLGSFADLNDAIAALNEFVETHAGQGASA